MRCVQELLKHIGGPPAYMFRCSTASSLHAPETFRDTHGDERKKRRLKHGATIVSDNRLAELFVAVQVRWGR